MEILVDGSPRACKQSRSSLLVASQKPGRGGRGTRGCPRLTTSAKRTPLEFRCWNTTATVCWFWGLTEPLVAKVPCMPHRPRTQGPSKLVSLGVRFCTTDELLLYYRATSSVSTCLAVGFCTTGALRQFYGAASSVSTCLNV